MFKCREEKCNLIVHIGEAAEPPLTYIFHNKQTSPFSQSDGSTETLSVMEVDEPSEHQEPPACNANFEETTKTNSNSEVAPLSERKESDQPCRSLSMDSAYGTLSPESLLRELQSQPGHSEGEETEEEEADVECQEVEQEEVIEEEKEDEEEGEEEEEENASVGSQLSVVQSFKPRRRPHVQPRFHCLQRLSTLALSRSEDNLLQRLHGKTPVSHKHSLNSAQQDQSQCRNIDMSSLVHSKSLSELGQNCMELLSSDLDQSEDCLSVSLPSDKLYNSLRSAEARHQAADGQCESQSNSSDSETGPSVCFDRKNESTVAGDSGEMPAKKRKSPAQQHKKLTLAQLYRIRTTLVLNSTLTAS